MLKIKEGVIYGSGVREKLITPLTLYLLFLFLAYLLPNCKFSL